LTDATTSEMVKLMENTYRDINIAIAMEFSRLADRFGVDIWEALAIANRHPRVNILNPGPGVGGHCISVDPWFLVEKAPDITPLIHTARLVNDGQPAFVLQVIQRLIPHLQGKRIAALGLAFKPDVDDLRESPAIEVIRKLVEAGAVVTACEPFRPDFQLDGVTVTGDLHAALQDAEVVILLVGHALFKALDPSEVAKMTGARLVLDVVNGFQRADWENAGFTLERLGDRKNSKL